MSERPAPGPTMSEPGPCAGPRPAPSCPWAPGRGTTGAPALLRRRGTPARGLQDPLRLHRQCLPLAHRRAADPARADRPARRTGPATSWSRARAPGATRARRWSPTPPRSSVEYGADPRGLRRPGAAGRARDRGGPGAHRHPGPPGPGDLHGPRGRTAHLHAQGVHPAGEGDRPGHPAGGRRVPGRGGGAGPGAGPRRRRAARLAAGGDPGGGRGGRPLRRAAGDVPQLRRGDLRRPGPDCDRADRAWPG